MPCTSLHLAFRHWHYIQPHLLEYEHASVVGSKLFVLPRERNHAHHRQDLLRLDPYDVLGAPCDPERVRRLTEKLYVWEVVSKKARVGDVADPEIILDLGVREGVF